MSQFTGSNTKVRCVDCSHFSGSLCSKKNTKVAPRKRRVCAVYGFKGEYENREAIPGRYMPSLDKKTRRFLKRMYQMGISPVVQEEEGVREGEGAYKRLPMPASTATAKILGTTEMEDPAMYQQVGPFIEQDSAAPEDEDAPDNSGG